MQSPVSSRIRQQCPSASRLSGMKSRGRAWWSFSSGRNCGSGHAESAQRSVEALKFAGDAIFTDVAAFCQALKRKGG
ncbi:hypothetical protein ABIC09_000046 [Bradyrhizobium sp. S3.12.5]|uniref:hypothetical protein n=1 Tax=Bradyrhizobium sp. S3.12.5 TaxID=3156386 RepID=UPI0033908968